MIAAVIFIRVVSMGLQLSSTGEVWCRPIAGLRDVIMLDAPPQLL
jgi:hypothetical protein